ncbi:MAG: hypothetical protein PV344_01655 [Anaplasma sp.]|nr:hypothetical protein [Anaplasma sp.]
MKKRSREQFGQYVNTMVATFDSRKLEPANNFRFSALPNSQKFEPAKIQSFTVLQYLNEH